ncbi:MAG: sensor histidine kinase [Solirubrobacterales bacterium]
MRVELGQNRVVVEVLERQNVLTHRRLLLATVVVLLMLLLITSWLETRGLTTPAVSQAKLYGLAVPGFGLLGLVWLIAGRFGERVWMKWLVVGTVFAVVTIARTVPTDAVESHGMYYIPIVMSLFYFDLRVIAASTAACIAGDFALNMIFPTLQPTGTFVATYLMRYYFYLCTGIGAGIATLTVRELMGMTARLQQMNLKLQALDDMRREFIAGASHELKTPLSLIKGYAEGLKENVATGADRDLFVDVINDEVRKMEALIGDLLDMCQLESGYGNVRFAPFDLGALVDSVVTEFSGSIAMKELALTVEKDGTEWQVTADSWRIYHVLANFITNAMLHTRPGNKLTVRLIARSEEVQVEVENEGAHIEENEMERIWEPFYRTDKSRNRDLGGTGLGLAIVRTILNLHHSTYGVRNTEAGVAFYFSLPRA